MICTMILAAGESRRMGTPKLLLPFGEKTVIETLVDEVLRSKSDKTVVVLGAEKEKIERILSNRPVKKVVNTRYQEGMLSSIQAGFGFASGISSSSLSLCLTNSSKLTKTQKKGSLFPYIKNPEVIPF